MRAQGRAHAADFERNIEKDVQSYQLRNTPFR